MNILFALYKDGETNSGVHAATLAQELNRMGHDCVIAVPGSETEHVPLVKGAHAPRIRSFTQVEQEAADANLFVDGRGADILHGWTPRNVVRIFLERIRPIVGGRLIVHLEDNEDELVRHFLGESVYLKALEGDLRKDFPETLTHPVDGREFIAGADGVTVLIEAMRGGLPEEMPSVVVWPAADEQIFHTRPPNTALRNALGLPSDAVVLVYTGNGHPANFTEIRSLYLAVHLLNRRGIVARLIRTGADIFGMDEGYRAWAARYTVALGRLADRRQLGELLSLADVLIQPGVAGPFNDLRFPSKLPEFFATGKPVVLPRSNIGLVTTHLEDAYVLDKADGPSIAAAVADIMQDPSLQQKLAAGARAFYDTHFSWSLSAEKLGCFYQKRLKADESQGASDADRSRP